MRRFTFQFGSGSGLDEQRLEDPFRRRMPATVHIGREVPRRINTPAPKPVTFGKRNDGPAVLLFQDPRNTRRTNAL
jgi:hypothetical protein